MEDCTETNRELNTLKIITIIQSVFVILLTIGFSYLYVKLKRLYDVVEVKKSKAVKVAQYIDEQSANNSVDKNLREDYFDLYEKDFSKQNTNLVGNENLCIDRRLQNTEQGNVCLKFCEQPNHKTTSLKFNQSENCICPLHGEGTRPGDLTWPTVQVLNYRGSLVIKASLVIHNKPFSIHPYKLVGEDCKDGTFERLYDVTNGDFIKLKLAIKSISLEDFKQLKRLSDDQTESDLTVYDPSRLRLKVEAFSNDILMAEVFSRAIEDTANENFETSVCRNTILKGKAEGNEVRSTLTPYQLPYNLNKDDFEIVFQSEDNKWWALAKVLSINHLMNKTRIEFLTPSCGECLNCYFYIRQHGSSVRGKPTPFCFTHT